MPKREFVTEPGNVKKRVKGGKVYTHIIPCLQLGPESRKSPVQVSGQFLKAPVLGQAC